MAWPHDPRPARSLTTLLNQINAQFPTRSKVSDGLLGDAAHASRHSDHNPNKDGVVCGMDITNDPAHGLPSEALAEALRLAKDDRISYIISNRKICSGSGQTHPAWVWRPYTGTNPHNHHVHISVKGDAAYYDDARKWAFAIDANVQPVPATKPAPSRPKLQMGDNGPNVVTLQERLNHFGAKLTADGKFGAKTKAAVLTFQKDHSLVPDGVAGPYTWGALLA